MGRLENELEKIRQELDALDTERLVSHEDRQRHTQALIEALQRGADVDEFDADEVERVREALVLYEPAAQRVLDRIAASGGTLGEDGGLRFDEQP